MRANKINRICENVFNNFVMLNKLDKQSLISALIQAMIVYDNLDFKEFIKDLQLLNKLQGLPYELEKD